MRYWFKYSYILLGSILIVSPLALAQTDDDREAAQALRSAADSMAQLGEVGEGADAACAKQFSVYFRCQASKLGSGSKNVCGKPNCSFGNEQLAALLTAVDEEDKRATAETGGSTGDSEQGITESPDPNAIVNAGNQQAAQIRAIGDANAAAQQRAAQEHIAAKQAADQQAAQVRLAQQQAQQAAAAQQAPQATQQQAVAVTEGELIKSANGPNVYVVQGGQLHLIPDPATLQSQWSWSEVQTVPQSTLDGIPMGSAISAVASQDCTNMDKWVSGTVKVASDGFVVGHLSNNSNQILYVSYTFAQGGMPSKSAGVGGGVTIHPGQTVGGEGGGMWTIGNTADTNPPHIYWHAVLQSDVDQGKQCGSEW